MKKQTKARYIHYPFGEAALSQDNAFYVTKTLYCKGKGCWIAMFLPSLKQRWRGHIQPGHHGLRNVLTHSLIWSIVMWLPLAKGTGNNNEKRTSRCPYKVRFILGTLPITMEDCTLDIRQLVSLTPTGMTHRPIQTLLSPITISTCLLRSRFMTITDWYSLCTPHRCLSLWNNFKTWGCIHCVAFLSTYWRLPHT